MRLEQLVLHGFKSFADSTVFEFPKNFTAVVGPNGSGKSNVSDAIRWVLGEQSMKLLRAKRAEDLIFGGSDKLAKQGMAQVELHLDNSDGVFPVEYQQVVISRKMFRNGESEYRLNESRVRLQDILMMLAQAKFGQKSYAVIGQGMITDFLNASPQERKEFFDEATGVKEFQIKRDQAINKLIRTEEHLVQSETLLAEIEPHLRSLTRQVNRLERREKIEVELREVQVTYYGSLWQELQRELSELQTQQTQAERVIAELDQQLAEQQAANDALALEESRAERYQHLQEQFNGLIEQKSQLLQGQAVLKGKLELEHERQGELSLVWLQRKEDEIVKDTHEHEATVELLRKQIERETAELARQEQQLESLRAEFREEEFSILKLREQIEQQAHSMTVPQIQVELRDIFEEHEELLRQLLQTTSLEQFKAVQGSARKAAERFAEFMDRLNAAERETTESLRVDMKRKEQSLEKLVTEREAAQVLVNNLRVSIESAKAKLDLSHTQLQRLQDELAEIQSNISETTTESGVDKNAQAQQYTLQLGQFTTQIEQLEKQQAAARAAIDEFNKEEEDKKSRLVRIQSDMRTLQRQLTNVRQDSNTVEVQVARLETRQEDMGAEMEREVPAEMHAAVRSFQSVETVSRSAVEKKMVSLQKQLEAIGSVDEEIVKEYEETKERHDFLQEQTQDMSKSIGSLEKIIDELDETIHKQFQRNFKKINDGFQKYFEVLFEGGKAQLEMITARPEEVEAESASAENENSEGEDMTDERLYEEKERELIGKKKKKQKVVSGIDVMASPPGKKIRNITALSGGEKSMIAIALLCSIIANNPSPFVVLDEVEAALDEENSEKLAAILKDLAKKTEIIVITHNRVTMRAADILYGVTMGKEGKSHILSVELDQAQEMVEEEVAA